MSDDIWIIGCGNMGGAMVNRWLDSGIAPQRVTIIDPALPAMPEGVTVVAAPPADAAPPSIALLSVKPQLLDAVAPQIAPMLGKETVLVSILAGVEISALRGRFANPQAIVRAMPNLPVALGRGVVALFADQKNAAVDALMQPLGLVEWLDSESLFDAVTALSGSGPAFLYRFIDALAQAGAALGLPREQSARLAMATVEGSATMAAAASESPATLADRVASKGGSTRTGLDVLDEGDALITLLTKTLEAAKRRNAEMAADAKR